MNVKRAMNNDEAQQPFFDAAYSILQDNGKQLLPYLLGFEIVEKQDDGKRMVGVFGFNAPNGKKLFVPAFWVNGNVKGTDYLYDVEGEQFFPLTPDWIELLVGAENRSVGKPSEHSREEVRRSQNGHDWRYMSVPPRTGKYSRASDDSEAGEESILLDYVKNGPNSVKLAFEKLAYDHPAFLEALLRFYPMDKVAEAIAKNYDQDKVTKNPDVKVVLMNDPTARDLSPEKKKEVTTKGYTVIDTRTADKKSVWAGEINTAKIFTNPDESGFYNYLTSFGSLNHGLVFTKPMALQGRFCTEDAIVINLDESNTGQAYLTHVKNVFIKDKIVVGDVKEFLDKKLSNLSSLETSYDRTYVLVNSKLQCTVPFKVLSKYTDAAKINRVRIELIGGGYEWDCDGDAKNIMDPNGKVEGQAKNHPRRIKGGYSSSSNAYVPVTKAKELTLVLTKSDGDNYTTNNGFVYIPNDYKVLELKFDGPHHHTFACSTADFDEDGRKKESLKWEAGKPGKRSSVFGALNDHNVFPFTLRENGSSYFANVRDVKKEYKTGLKAKIGMILDFGFSQEDAEALVDTTDKYRKVTGYAKLAYLGDTTPNIQDEQPYTDELGHQTYEGVPWQEEAQSDNEYQPEPWQLGRNSVQGENFPEENGSPDQSGQQGKPYDIGRDVQEAVQLAEGGQQDLFNVKGLETLTKYTNTESSIADYMPQLVAALDKLGRLGFQLNWDMDAFIEMYGRSDIPKFKDLLESVFENLGDLIIFLKRKSPELSINMSETETLEM